MPLPNANAMAAAPAPAPGGMVPAVPEGGMAPTAAPVASEAEQTQVAVENLNIAQAGAMEALEAVKANPSVQPETEQKIEQAVVLLDEAKNEVAAPAPGPDGGEAAAVGTNLGSGAEI